MAVGALLPGTDVTRGGTNAEEYGGAAARSCGSTALPTKTACPVNELTRTPAPTGRRSESSTGPKGGRNGTLGAKQLLEPCNTGSKMVEQISDMPGRFVPHTPHHHILLLKLHPRVREHLHFRFIYPDTKPTQANTYRNGTYGPTCFLGNAWWHCTEPGSLKCHAVSSGAA